MVDFLNKDALGLVFFNEFDYAGETERFQTLVVFVKWLFWPDCTI